MGYTIPMTRRNFVRAGTAVAGTFLLGTSIRRSGPAPAGAQTSAPPTVDRLAVRVVVDSYQDALVRTARVGEVEVQRFGVVSGAGLGKHVHNEFGLSLHLESQRGSETRKRERQHRRPAETGEMRQAQAGQRDQHDHDFGDFPEDDDRPLAELIGENSGIR